MKYLLQWVLILLMGICSSMYGFDRKVLNPSLQQAEKRFHKLETYTLKDFNFAWDIHYFEVVTYEVDRTLPLKKENKFKPFMHAGTVKLDRKRKKELLWLSKAILKKSYFWKRRYPLLEDYSVTSLRFIDGSGRFKAIETLRDIREMLGDIDTEAELRLWILASEQPYMDPYSYIKKDGLYRVRFQTVSHCHYKEFFRYYNKKGDVVKNRNIKKIDKKNCEEPVI
jgi:hypothetical protein